LDLFGVDNGEGGLGIMSIKESYDLKDFKEAVIGNPEATITMVFAKGQVGIKFPDDCTRQRWNHAMAYALETVGIN
jgi:hypothetical protein